MTPPDYEFLGKAVPLKGGPWDGQQVFVPQLPSPPDSLTFPVQMSDGTWDNAHWVYRYFARKGHDGTYYDYVGIVPAPGLTDKEREQLKEWGKGEALTHPPEPDKHPWGPKNEWSTDDPI